MGAWEIFTQQRTNANAPEWLSWLAAAFFIVLVLGMLWFQFGPITPEPAPLKDAVKTALAVDSAVMDQLEEQAGSGQSEVRNGLQLMRVEPWDARVAVLVVKAHKELGWARQGAGQAEVSVPASGGRSFCVGFHWYYKDDVKRIAGRYLRTDKILTVHKLHVLSPEEACP